MFDSDILIDVARKIPAAVSALKVAEKEGMVSVSSVTQMELIVGCQNKRELRKTEQFLKRFRIIPINESITDIAVSLLKDYNLSHDLQIADALIAATALSLDLPFRSKNQRDFKFIANLNLLPYPPK